MSFQNLSEKIQIDLLKYNILGLLCKVGPLCVTVFPIIYYSYLLLPCGYLLLYRILQLVYVVGYLL